MIILSMFSTSRRSCTFLTASATKRTVSEFTLPRLYMLHVLLHYLLTLHGLRDDPIRG